MKHFKGLATTQLEGMEWGQDFITKAKNLESAHRKAGRNDWTHGDGIEQLEAIDLQEIPESDYEVLKKYLLEV